MKSSKQKFRLKEGSSGKMMIILIKFDLVQMNCRKVLLKGKFSTKPEKAHFSTTHGQKFHLLLTTRFSWDQFLAISL